ncbi:MAG: DUF1566 domain-containing protein [Campylobacterales bacterium]|nr:DUF1566 domain-containing protein [Campylobacterales bacterium]
MKAILVCIVPILLWGSWHEHKGLEATYEQAQATCKGMGKEWRLPDIRELFTLKGQTEVFSPNQSYWGSNTVYDGIVRGNTGSEGEGGDAKGTEQGFTFFLQDGDIALAPLHKRSGVLCTNAKKSNGISPYAKRKDGIVDDQNDLLWLGLDATEAKTRYSFEEAIEHCESLSHYNRSWRLPTLEELYSIVDYAHNGPSVNTDYFGAMMHRYYWSATPFSEEESYVVGFKFGTVATSSKKNRSYVRCVSEL